MMVGDPAFGSIAEFKVMPTVGYTHDASHGLLIQAYSYRCYKRILKSLATTLACMTTLKHSMGYSV